MPPIGTTRDKQGIAKTLNRGDDMGLASEWDEELLTGDAAIDEQHRELFALTEQLGQAIATGQGEDLVGSTLEELIGYAALHFRDEEALMADIEYPGLRSQSEAHAAFAADATRMQNEWLAGTGVSSEVLHAYIRDWLTQHVRTVDLLLARFLKAEREDG